MAKKPANKAESQPGHAQAAKSKAKPGRKRMGQDVFVPVTMKVEPSELATIEAIAKASGRSRSDVMREMLSYGLSHMLEQAFAPKAKGAPEKAESHAEAAATADAAPDDVRAQRRAVEALVPAAKAGTATLAQWAQLAWRSAAILCVAATGQVAAPPEGPLQTLSTLAPERASATAPGSLQTVLGFSEGQAATLGRAARLVLRSGLLEGEAPSVDAGAAVRDAIAAIAQAAVGPRDSSFQAQSEAGSQQPPVDADATTTEDNPQWADVLAQKGARKIIDYVSRHPRANTGELLAATGVSSSTLRRRIAALQDAGALFNDGTAARPIWRVPGVEHSPEDMLTATQAAVLGLMRREPPKTACGNVLVPALKALDKNEPRRVL